MRLLDHRGHQTRYPTYFIIPVDWIDEYDDRRHWFLRKLPARRIIEIIASVPTTLDYEPFIHSEIDNILTPDVVDRLDIADIDFIIEIIIERYYNELNNILHPDLSEEYVFHRWLGPYSISLIKIGSKSDPWGERLELADQISTDYVPCGRLLYTRRKR